MNGKINVNQTRNWHPGIPHLRGTIFDGTKNFRQQKPKALSEASTAKMLL